MRILMVSSVFPPGFIGGFELGAFEVAEALARLGHRLRVLTSGYFLDDEGKLASMDVDRSLDLPSLSHQLLPNRLTHLKGVYHNYWNIRKLAHEIRTWEPDVTLLFNIQGLGALSILRMLSDLGTPTVVYMMDTPLFGIQHMSKECRLYEWVFGTNSLRDNIRFVAMSDTVLREFSAALGRPCTADAIIPGWIHEDLLPEAKQLTSSDEQVRFVYCSRIAGHKGTDIMLDAAELLSRDGIQNFVIDTYGDGQVAHFVQSIRARGLDRYVRFLGARSKQEVQVLLGDYDALLFPTWEREPFGFVVSEAAAAGCLPVMTRGIGAGDWFFHEVDCLKVERSGLGLKQSMYLVIAMGADERLKMRQAAMRTARQVFPFRIWLPRIEAVCHNAAARGRSIDKVGNRRIVAAYQFLGQFWNDMLTE